MYLQDFTPQPGQQYFDTVDSQTSQVPMLDIYLSKIAVRNSVKYKNLRCPRGCKEDATLNSGKKLVTTNTLKLSLKRLSVGEGCFPNEYFYKSSMLWSIIAKLGSFAVQRNRTSPA